MLCMDPKTKATFDPAPYKKAILEIQSVERRILKEISQEAERQDKEKELLHLSNDAS